MPASLPGFPQLPAPSRHPLLDAHSARPPGTSWKPDAKDQAARCRGLKWLKDADRREHASKLVELIVAKQPDWEPQRAKLLAKAETPLRKKAIAAGASPKEADRATAAAAARAMAPVTQSVAEATRKPQWPGAPLGDRPREPRDERRDSYSLDGHKYAAGLGDGGVVELVSRRRVSQKAYLHNLDHGYVATLHVGTTAVCCGAHDSLEHAAVAVKEMGRWLSSVGYMDEAKWGASAMPKLCQLFARWDADSSGFLEAKELNRAVAIWNGDEKKLREGGEEAAAAYAEKFLKIYDDNGAADKKLDFTEMAEYLFEQAESFAGVGADLPHELDLVVEKFLQIIAADGTAAAGAGAADATAAGDGAADGAADG
eukprot:SAG22_NODE_1007_length_6056_cov_7.409938_1_plen_369_part_10